MSWFDGEGAPDATGAAETGASGGGAAGAAPGAEDGAGEATGDLTGKPEWMPDAFWMAPGEGGTADYAAMAEKMAGSLKEGRAKISQQGEALARHTVPDSVTPYLEGLDKGTLVSTHARSGLDDAQIDQFMAQARSAGIGPGPAQGLLQSWMKSRHEATPEAKTGEALRDAAVAELNAQGRPGSEMARRIRTWGAGLVRENKLSADQAGALEAMTHSAHGLEALHALMGAAPAAPVGGTQMSNAGSQILDDIQKEMDDPRFGVDSEYTERVAARMQQHESLFEKRYGSISRE